MSILKGNSIVAGNPSSPNWGAIEGNLNDQIDLKNVLTSKANLDSPILTGIPTAPTAPSGSSNNQVANTAFVQNALDNIDALPSQAGQSGKILSTDGTNALWIPNTASIEIDNTSITKNNQNKLQASGVIEKNAGAVKYDWIGTYAQWQAGRTGGTIPDSWICYITDDDGNGFTAEQVLNQNTNEAPVKVWTGTKNEYNNIQNKDPYTIYNITDDNDTSMSLLEMIYPIGSIYIGTMNVCPLSALFGTWEKVSSGRVLQGADENHNPGTTIEAGLPNITGRIGTNSGQGFPTFTEYSSGALYEVSTTYNRGTNNVDSAGTTVALDASRSSSIYGNSTTVQPPAFVVNIWKRTE